MKTLAKIYATWMVLVSLPALSLVEHYKSEGFGASAPLWAKVIVYPFAISFLLLIIFGVIAFIGLIWSEDK